MGTVVLADWLVETPNGLKPRESGRRPIRGRYDAATLDHYNEKHWAMADGLSAREANNPAVRERLRNYARYETANNCYARGMIDTLADVEIGYGAHLHLPRPLGASQAVRDGLKFVEREFEAWAEVVGLWAKLRTARVAKAQDGEGIGVLRINESLDHVVTLAIQLIESEQLSHGWQQETFEPDHVDGVKVNDFGDPEEFYVLPEHPGDATVTKAMDPQAVRPQALLQWFKCDRPGQLRGIPEITPALPIFAQLRRFTLASLTAAETAADVAAVIRGTATPEWDDLEGARDGFDEWPIHRGSYLELPDGTDISQLRSEHPGPNYVEFKRELLCEAARCMNLPKAMALADASDYNYASGRLDRQAFDRHIETARYNCELQVLRKVWNAWWAMASRIEGYIPEAAVSVVHGSRPHWLWRVLGHVDRSKEEQGRQLALGNLTTSLAEELGREGVYWEDHLEQVAEERRRMTELGLAASPNSDGSGSNSTEENHAEEHDRAAV